MRISVLDMLAEIESKAAWRDKHSRFVRCCLNGMIASWVFESPVKQQLVNFIEIVYVHTDKCKVMVTLEILDLSNINVEAVCVFHAYICEITCTEVCTESVRSL